MYQRPMYHQFEEVEERLRTEKTVVSELVAEDLLVRRLCASVPDSIESSNHEVKVKILQKLMKELGGKIKSNQYLLVFDEARIRNGKNSRFRSTEDIIEVILPIRRPPNAEIHHLSQGYFFLKGSGKDKLPKISNELSESMWVEDGMDSIFSAEKVNLALLNVLQGAIHTLSQSLLGYMSIEDVSVNPLNHSLECLFEFSKEYLNLRIADRPQTSADVNEEDSDSRSTSPGNVPAIQSRRFTIRGSIRTSLDIALSIRVIAAVTVSVKERTYLIAMRPNLQADHPRLDHLMRHCWFQDCWWKEQALLDKISAADKGLRLSALVGMQRICAVEVDLALLTPMGLLHNLLLQLDQHIDDPFSGWQRRSLYNCLLDQIEFLRGQMHSKKVANFFNPEHNLLDRDHIVRGTVAKAVMKLSSLLGSKSALIRCLEEVGRRYNNPGVVTDNNK